MVLKRSKSVRYYVGMFWTRPIIVLITSTNEPRFAHVRIKSYQGMRSALAEEVEKARRGI